MPRSVDWCHAMPGHLIEDFEDATFLPGFSATGTTANFGTYTHTVWDGTQNWGADNRFPITFAYAPGTTSFGIGLSDFDGPNETQLSINGTFVSFIDAIPGWSNPGDNLRDVYLVIEAEGGDPLITSVGFVDGSGTESLTFDHVAIGTAAPVPEPSTWLFALLAVAGLTGARARV